jgi:hypothetical protein
MSIYTDRSPCLELCIEMFPYSFWLSTERIADKVNALLITIIMAICTVSIDDATILRNTICFTLISLVQP